MWTQSPLTGPSGHLSPMKDGGEEWREIAAGSPLPCFAGERWPEGPVRGATCLSYSFGRSFFEPYQPPTAFS